VLDVKTAQLHGAPLLPGLLEADAEDSARASDPSVRIVLAGLSFRLREPELAHQLADPSLAVGALEPRSGEAGLGQEATDLLGLDVRLAGGLGPLGRRRGKVAHVPMNRSRFGTAFARHLREREAREGPVRERSVHARKQEGAGLTQVGETPFDLRASLLG